MATQQARLAVERAWPLYGVYVLIVGLAVFMVASLTYGVVLVSRIDQTYGPQAEAAQNIRYEVAATHLWLEEALDADRYNSQSAVGVTRHLDQARHYLLALQSGGPTPTGRKLKAVTNPGQQTRLAHMTTLLGQFRQLTLGHFLPLCQDTDNRQPCNDMSQANRSAQVDHIYNALIRASERLYQEVQRTVAAKHNLFRRDLLILIVANLIMGVGAGLYVRRFERRKMDYRNALEAEIAERKVAQEGLNHAQAIAHLGHWEWTPANDHFTCSEETQRILGQPNPHPEHYEGGFDAFLKAVHPDDRPLLKQQLDRVLNGGISERFDHRLLRRDGETRYVRARLMVEPTPSGSAQVVCTVRDITDRKQAEAAMRESEARYLLLFETMAQGVVLYDGIGNVTSANPAALEMLGVPVEKMGRTHPTHPFAHAVTDNGQPVVFSELPAIRALNSGQPITDQVIGLASPSQKGERRWLRVSATPQFRDGETTPYQVHATYTDITEQRRLEEQFRQALRMEALGTLVGGIAHDFNNILTSLQGTLLLAKKRVHNPDAVIEKLDTAEKLGIRAADMVTQLMAFSCQRKVALTPCNLNLVITEAIKGARVSIPQNITLHTHLPKQDQHVHGDATLLQQVLVNLLFNARDALENRPHPAIDVVLEVQDDSARLRRNHPALSPGPVAHLSVADNGCGIQSSHLGKLFEPFFTTKEVGKGTGLGLAMAYGTITAHGGALVVDSQLDVGTTFHIYLPLARHAVAVPPAEAVEIPPARKGEVILLADDEELVRLTAADILSELGYQVLVAEDGARACELFEADPDAISLVLMDVVMPNLGGVDAVRRMRALRPQLPVIFTTGYDRHSVLPEDTDWRPMRVLNKPYAMDALGRKIRALLDTRSVPQH